MPVSHLGVQTNTRESKDGHLVKFCLGHECTPLLWGWPSVLTQPQLLQLLEQTSTLGLLALRLQIQVSLSCNDHLLYQLPSAQSFYSFILPLLRAMMEYFLCASTALRTADMAVSKTDYFVLVSILWHWILLSTSKEITLNLNLKSNPVSITYMSLGFWATTHQKPLQELFSSVIGSLFLFLKLSGFTEGVALASVFLTHKPKWWARLCRSINASVSVFPFSICSSSQLQHERN